VNTLRYSRVSPNENPPPNRVLPRLAALATAPFYGSRLVFPRHFDSALERLATEPESQGVSPEHALWYFGAALHLDIDPLSLTHRISDWVRDRRGMHWVGVSFLDAADWTDALSRVEESPVHREMLEIVAAGRDFRDTEAYRRMLKAIELGRPSKRNNIRLATVEQVDAYFGYCRDLIKSMKKRGVVRHRVSWAFHRLRVKHRDARHPLHDSAERDIGVAITADGRIIRHLGGKHRTAIAQALKLPTMPVEIHMVHTDWIAKQVAASGLPPHRALAEGIRRFRSPGARQGGQIDGNPAAG
jgi:hypothetical protein